MESAVSSTLHKLEVQLETINTFTALFIPAV